MSTLIMSESWVLKKSYNEDEIHSSLYTIEKINKIIWLSFVKITNQPRIQLLKKVGKNDKIGVKKIKIWGQYLPPPSSLLRNLRCSTSIPRPSLRQKMCKKKGQFQIVITPKKCLLNRQYCNNLKKILSHCIIFTVLTH